MEISRRTRWISTITRPTPGRLPAATSAKHFAEVASGRRAASAGQIPRTCASMIAVASRYITTQGSSPIARRLNRLRGQAVCFHQAPQLVQRHAEQTCGSPLGKEPPVEGLSDSSHVIRGEEGSQFSRLSTSAIPGQAGFIDQGAFRSWDEIQCSQAVVKSDRGNPEFVRCPVDPVMDFFSPAPVPMLQNGTSGNE